MRALESAFWDDAKRFPRGAIVADSAFLMRGVATRWESVEHRPRVTGDGVL